MTDLEMTKLCAEAMGWEIKPAEIGPDRWRVYVDGEPTYGIGEMWIIGRYKPLEDDAQAMALVKKLKLGIVEPDSNGWWTVCRIEDDYGYSDKDLNRAIVECVAKMQEDKP